MTGNSKIPPAKKTIQDPPEYAAVNKLKGQEGQATYQQNGQSYQQNGQSAVAPASNDQRDGRVGTGNVSGDWLGGPQNGAETEVNDRGRVPADDIKEKKAPKGSLGGVDEQQGGGPDVG